jgi:chromosome segregation ATPase
MASLHSTLDDQVRLLQEKLEGMQGYAAGGVLQAVATTRMEEDVAELVITEGNLGTASLAHDQVSKVDADIDCIASELAVLGAQVRALKLEQETSEQRVSAAQRQVSALENEQSFLGSELTSNREELRKLDVQVAERAESLRVLHEEAGRVTEMLSSLKAEVEAGKEVRDAALKEAALLGETAERSRRAREEDDNHRAELERETTALRDEVKALMEERWRLSSAVETLSEEWRIAQASLSSMESHRAEAYELEARIEELAKQLKTQRETQGSLVEEMEVLEEKRARVIKSIQEMENSRSELADKHALQTADHVKVERAVKLLSEERTSGHEALQTQREELKKLQEEIDKTTGQLHDKMKALADLEARIAVAQSECEAQEREGHRQKTIIRSAQEEYVWLQVPSCLNHCYFRRRMLLIELAVSHFQS